MTARLFAVAVLLLPVIPAAAEAPRTGSFTISLFHATPLADAHEVAGRLGMGDRPSGQDITPTRESWHVHVPEDYSGAEAYGVLVWVSPSESGELPGGWQHVLEDHKLIYVAADHSGNTQDAITRRIPLALIGLAGIESAYRVDPSRIYIGGFSGGGITASHIAAAYADIFTGGLFVSTSHGIGTADMPVPALASYQAMRSHGRYVFTAGTEETDNQIMTTHAIDAFRALCVLRVKYLRIPNAGHGNLESRVFQQALRYLDAPSEPTASDQSVCEQALNQRRTDAITGVRQAIQARDQDKARALLHELATDFGPLAEPEYSQLSACLTGTTSQACPAAPGG